MIRSTTLMLLAAAALCAGPLHGQESLVRRAEPWPAHLPTVVEARDQPPAQMKHAAPSFVLGGLGGMGAGAGLYLVSDGQVEGFPFVAVGTLVAYAGARLGRDPVAALVGFGLGAGAALLLISMIPAT
jgi:hypothetical protein